MSLYLRSWLVVLIVVAAVQGILAFLLVLQHSAVLSDLTRSRVAVVAQTTGAAFQPIVDLGLPISMVRNVAEIASRAMRMDPNISAVHVFNPSGIFVFSTDQDRPQSIPERVLHAMRLASGQIWSVETETELDSGYTIRARNGNPVGAIVVAYPKDSLRAASASFAEATLRLAALIWLISGALAFAVLRLMLSPTDRALRDVETRLAQAEPLAADGQDTRAMLRHEIAQLEGILRIATRRFHEARDALSAPFPDRAAEAGSEDTQDAEITGLTSAPRGSMAQQVATRVAMLASALIAGSALLLGALSIGTVNRSIEPELAARSNLIGTVVSENVQRALDAGVPLDGIVGAEAYFGEILRNLPEVAYVAVATGRIVLEVGERIDPYLAPARERKEVRSHPIIHGGEEVAYVVIDIDPRAISTRFRDVMLDVGAVILVTALLAFEILVLLSSRTLTASLAGLQRLAEMQARGDFSRRIPTVARTAVARIGGVLVTRSRALQDLLSARLAEAADQGARARLRRLGERFGLRDGGPLPLHLGFFTDVRLALFLFAAADQLPLSFLPLYTRAAYNPIPWIGGDLVLSLPLAGYVLAILVVAPWSAGLVARFGARRVMVAASLPTLIAHVGLAMAATVPEIVFWRAATGAGYALVSLACQDYALAIGGPGERNRSLGQFSAVLFGGIFCGAALGGVLADRIGQANVFLVSALLIAVSALLFALVMAPSERRPDPAVPPAVAPAPGRVRLMGSGTFARLVLGIAIPANIMLQAFIAYLVALLLDALGASAADIGRTLMVYFLAVAFVSPLGGRAAEAGVPVELLALGGQALAGAAVLCVALWPQQLVILMAVALAGVGHGAVRGAQVAIALQLAETEFRPLGAAAIPRLLGSLRGYERLGSVAGLILIAWMADLTGYAGATAVVAAASLLGALMFVPAAREPLQRVGRQLLQ